MTIQNEPRLQAYIDRLERIDSERDALGEDFKEVIKEAEGTGFQGKIIRKVLARRKKEKRNKALVQEEIATFDLYWNDLDDSA